MTSPTRPLLAHPDLVESIEGTLLNRGIPPQDVPDAVADVQLRALEASLRGKAPSELGPLRAFCNRIARDYAIDQTRRLKVQSRHHLGLCEDPDAHADEERGVQEIVERERLVRILQDQIVGGEMPEHAMHILHAEAAGVPHKTTGSELGLTHRAVECRLAEIRRRFRERLSTLGLTRSRS